MAHDRSRSLRAGAPAAVALAGSLAAIATGWWLGGSADERAVLIARYTARVSLALFLVVYVSGPLARGWPTRMARVVEAHWHEWVTAFLVAHLIHFATMIRVFVTRTERLDLAALLFGPIAYLLPLTLLIALPRGLRPARKWARLATLQFVWFSFTATYYHRLFDAPDRRAAGVFAFVVLVAALAIRLAAAIRTGTWLARD